MNLRTNGLQPGDLAEYGHEQDLVTVVGVFGRKSSILLGGAEVEVSTSLLTWVPRPEDIAASAQALREKYLAERRGCDSLAKNGRQTTKVVATANGRRNGKNHY